MKAGAPISVGKLSGYSDSNSDRGITWAIFTQPLSADNFPPKGSSKSEGEGGASSALIYTIARGDATVPKLYIAVFLALVNLFLLRPPIECLLGQLIQQALFTNLVRVLTAMPHRRTDLPLILASDTDLP